MSSLHHSHIREIQRKNPELLPHAKQFIQYLNEIENKTYRITGIEPHTGLPIEKEIEHIGRYCETYQKSVIARFYKLEDAWGKDCEITMLTITTAQNGEWSQQHGRPVSIFESFYLLKEGWKKLRKRLNMEGITEYVYVIEPHESGYPHMHVLIKGVVSAPVQERLSWLWAYKYKIGSLEHGLSWDVKVGIASVRNYAIKYIAKSISRGDWSYGEFVWHLCMWLGDHRAWGSSRSVTRIMKRESEMEDVEENPMRIRWDNGKKLTWERIFHEELIHNDEYKFTYGTDDRIGRNRDPVQKRGRAAESR